MQLHHASGVVARALATALEVHRERQIERVAYERPDHVADDQRQASHQGEISTVARYHVEENQREPPQRQSRPTTVHTLTFIYCINTHTAL